MKTLKEPKNEAISVREVAEFLKLHRETVNKMIKSGELPALKVGTAFRLNRIQIMEWARSRRARMQPED
jgi:excisionase family DNA binding protein